MSKLRRYKTKGRYFNISNRVIGLESIITSNSVMIGVKFLDDSILFQLPFFAINIYCKRYESKSIAKRWAEYHRYVNNKKYKGK